MRLPEYGLLGMAGDPYGSVCTEDDFHVLLRLSALQSHGLDCKSVIVSGGQYELFDHPLDAKHCRLNDTDSEIHAWQIGERTSS